MDTRDTKTRHRSLDVLGKRVDEHLRKPTREDQAASTIQHVWRQYYRAKHLHRDPNLFSRTSSDSRKNQLTIPPRFSSFFSQHKILPLFTTTKHFSRHLKTILHDGILYPRIKTDIDGIGCDIDESRHDYHMVFTTPNGNAFGMDHVTFSIADLFHIENGKKVVFKYTDWASGKFAHFNLTNTIRLGIDASSSDLTSVAFTFTDTNSGQLLATIKMPGESLVYHRLNGLNAYFTYYLFKVIEALPKTRDGRKLKNDIYDYLLGLSDDALSHHLREFALSLCDNCELNFINELKLSFLGIKNIYLNRTVYDFDYLREIVTRNDKQAILEFFEDTNITSVFDDSYFLAKGLWEFANQCKSKSIISWLEKHFATILNLPRHTDIMGTAEEESGLLNFSEFEFVSGAHGSNQDAGKYTHNGQTYYVKFYATDEQARTEALASHLYEKAAFTQKCVLVKRDNASGKPSIGVASEWENDLRPIFSTAVDYSKLHDCYPAFLIDVWLANWDVIGLSGDNLCLDQDGSEPYSVRIDFGGALHFRANGKFKTHFLLNDAVPELETMLNPAINQQAARVFGGIKETDLKISAMKLKRFNNATITKDVEKYFPGDYYARFRRQLIDTLIMRRDTILKKYQLTLNDPFELIAEDIIGQYVFEIPVRLKHGAMHVSRVAIYLPAIAALYRKRGYEISNEDVRLMQIAALFHDSGRESDTADDCPTWEREGKRKCYAYLKKLGVEESKAIMIACSINHKDTPVDNPQKSIYEKLLQNADCLDVLRSHHWTFSVSYMDYFAEFPDALQTDQEAFDLLTDAVKLVAGTCDLFKEYCMVNSKNEKLVFAPTYDRDTKEHYEHARDCFAQLLSQAMQLKTLSNLYQSGLGISQKRTQSHEYHLRSHGLFETENTAKRRKTHKADSAYSMNLR